MDKETYRKILLDNLDYLKSILEDERKISVSDVIAYVSLRCDICDKIYHLDNDKEK